MFFITYVDLKYHTSLVDIVQEIVQVGAGCRPMLIRSDIIKVQSQKFQPFLLTEGERNTLMISYLGITNPNAIADIIGAVNKTDVPDIIDAYKNQLSG